LDTIWFYEKKSPFGNEAGNRTVNILSDDSLNVYVSGPFRNDSTDLLTALFSKLNKDGELVWERYLSLEDSTGAHVVKDGFLFNDKLWYTIDQVNGTYFGGIVVLDTDGTVLFNERLKETAPYGRAQHIDVLNDEVLITCSSGPGSSFTSDSIYQHILHYRIDTVTSKISTIPSSILLSPYPNPTADWVSFLDVPVSQIEDFVVTDINGRVVNIDEDSIVGDRINLSRLNNGIYIIKYRVGRQVYLAKVVKN